MCTAGDIHCCVLLVLLAVLVVLLLHVTGNVCNSFTQYTLERLLIQD